MASYAPGPQQAQHYHPGAPLPPPQQPPPPVDERYAPVVHAGTDGAGGYAPNLAGTYAADIAPYSHHHQQQQQHQQQPPIHSLSSLQQRQHAPPPPPPLAISQPYYDGAYNGQQQPPGVDMRNSYPVSHPPPHSAPPLQAVHPSQQGHYSVQGGNPGAFQAQNLPPPGPPRADVVGQYHNQYVPPPPSQLQQGHFGQSSAQPYQQQQQPPPPPQQYAYSSVSASATETYAHGQPQYQQQQQPPPPPMVHAHTTGPYGTHPPQLHRPAQAPGHVAHNPEVYHQHTPQHEQQYYAPPPPQHQPPPPSQPQHFQAPPQLPPTSSSGTFAYSQPETGYYRQEPARTGTSPLYQSPYQQQQQQQQQQRQQQVQQQQVQQQQVQQQAYQQQQQQANSATYSSSAYSLPPPSQQQVHYSPPSVAQAVPPPGELQPPVSRYRAQASPPEPHHQNHHDHGHSQHYVHQHHDHSHGHELGPQQPHAMPPPSQQRHTQHQHQHQHQPQPQPQQYQQHPPPPHHSPSPQAQQMVGPQRHNSHHRVPVGHNDPVRIPGARPVMATRQDARLSYAEHPAQYIAGHPPISSVMTAEPIVAPAGSLSSASIQRKHSLDPRNSYGGSPQVGDSGSVGSAHGRRREASDYHEQQREALGPPPMSAAQHGGNNISALANSMGALSVASGQQHFGASSPHQQPQQLHHSSALTASAISVPNSQHLHSSQATLQGYPANGSASTLLASGAFAGTDLSKSSTPTLVQSGANIAYPLWHNIDANSFHAYRHHISVQKSNLTGTKYALVIGINYYGVEYSQTSNINSAHTLKNLLVSKYGYMEKNVTLLSDDLKDQRFHPTHQLITKHIGRMMGSVRPNDSVFFYFCGFGRLPSQLLDRRSEVLSAIRRLRADYILPADFEQYGAIDATYLHHQLVQKLPPSARLTALFNCIVNETGMGVPYKYTTNGMAVLTNAIAGSNLFEAGAKMTQQNVTGSFGDLSQRFETSLMQQQTQQCVQHQQQQQPLAAGGLADEEVSRLKQSSGDIIVFGWDRDYSNPKHKKYLSQTPSNHLGSYWAAAMEGALRNKNRATFGDILHYLKSSTNELVMMPFVATGRKISMDEEFII